MNLSNMAGRHSSSDHIITEYKTMDSEGKRLGQVLEQKHRSRSMKSILSTDTGYDTVTPSRSGSVQSFNPEDTEVLVKQVQNLSIDEKSLSEKFHPLNSDGIGKFLII